MSDSTNKNNNNINSCYVPYDIMARDDLSRIDIFLYAIIHSFNVNGEICYAGNAWLCNKINCTERTLLRSMSKLIKLKLIKRGFDDFGGRRLKSTYLYNTNGTITENNIDNDIEFDALTISSFTDIDDTACSDLSGFSTPVVNHNNKYNNKIDDKSSIINDKSFIELKDKSFSTTKDVNPDISCSCFTKKFNKIDTEKSNHSCYEKIENEQNNNAVAYENTSAVPVMGEAQVQAQAQFRSHITPSDDYIVKAEQLQLHFTDSNNDNQSNTANQLNENNTKITQIQNINGDEDMEFKKTDIFGNSNTKTTNIDDIKTGLDIETKSAEPLVMSIKLDKNKSGLMKSHIKQNRVTTAQKKNKYVEFCEYAKNIGTNEQLTFSIQRYVKWLLGNRKVDFNQWQITIDTLKSELDKISSPDIRLQAAIESFDTSYASGYVKLFIDKYKYNRYMTNVNVNSRPRYGIQNSPIVQSNSNAEEQNQSEIKDVSYITSENGKPITI